MPDRDARYRVQVDVGMGREPTLQKPTAETPFRVALLGDFRGRGAATGGAGEIAGRKPILVDRDNFDDVLSDLAPEIRCRLGGGEGPEVTVRIADLDDFHPDRLYEYLPLFHALRDLRDRLDNPRTFARAAEELLGEPLAEMPPAPARSKPRTHPTGGNLLDQMLEDAVGPAAEGVEAAPPPPEDDLQAFIRRVVAPHRVPDEDPRQAELVAQVDEAISEQMRQLLHHPAFQAVESLWRSLFLLVRGTETDNTLRLYILDISRAELEADLAGDRELQDTGLYRLLVDGSVGTPGADPWALLAGCYSFGPAAGDVDLLSRLGRIARDAGAPWIAAAQPDFAGLASFQQPPEPPEWDPAENEAWTRLRQSPEARFLGLALPRFLTRLPYGRDAESCDSFAFEEMSLPPRHEDYLWGNPAVACTMLLAQSFTAAGWELRPGMHLDIDGLPLHLYREAGTTAAKPCAESVMTERAAARIMDRGIMPVATMKDSAAVRLVRYQSIADPLAALAGRWNA